MPELELAPETLLTPAPVTPVGDSLSPAPWHFRFTGEDAIEIASYNAVSSARIAVHGRTWHPETGIHPFAFQHIPTADRARTLEVFGLPFGYLLNLVVFAPSGSPKIGQTFVSVHVIRGRGQARILLATLLQGYVTAEQELAFPGSPIQNSIEAGGHYRLVVGTDPAAGAEIVETVPTGARWELVTFQGILQVNATVTPRRPLLVFDDGTTAYASLWANGSVTTSEVGAFLWGQGLTRGEPSDTGRKIGSLPTNVGLLAGSRIRTITENLQAADNWQAPHMFVREWLEAQ